MSEKILIIKLGALGDVIRTMPLLIGIKEKYHDSEIHWITKPNAKEILETSPHINKVSTIPIELSEEYDILYNFDIESEATSLAQKTKANKKLGFYSEGDYAAPFNLPAEYYLTTLFDDELKKSNKKTYQEMMFETAEIPYNKQHHPIYLSEQDKAYAKNFINENNLNQENLIGIHIGSSPRWPSKSWHKNKIIEFIKQAKQKEYNIILFAGPDDIEKQETIFNELQEQQIKIYKNNPLNTLKEFSSLVNLCKTIISSDSLAMHISLGLKKPTIALFFCTSHNEVEDYGLLKKIISSQQCDFFPEKMDQYSEELVNSISAQEVLKAIENIK